jgi:hypothetical protein
MKPDIEAVIATYGTPTPNQGIISEEVAMQLWETLKGCEHQPLDYPGYYLEDVRIEGDRSEGKVVATFTWQ